MQIPPVFVLGGAKKKLFSTTIFLLKKQVKLQLPVNQLVIVLKLSIYMQDAWMTLFTGLESKFLF